MENWCFELAFERINIHCSDWSECTHSKFWFFFFSSEEEGEEILRQRGQFPALPFTASDTGSPSPRSPRSPGSVSSYSNGSSPHPVGVPWGDFSATGNFKFPNMPHKYSSNGRVKKKPPSEGIAKSPGSGKFCFISSSFRCRLKI